MVVLLRPAPQILFFQCQLAPPARFLQFTVHTAQVIGEQLCSDSFQSSPLNGLALDGNITAFRGSVQGRLVERESA